MSTTKSLEAKKYKDTLFLLLYNSNIHSICFPKFFAISLKRRNQIIKRFLRSKIGVQV